jgi:hypothetical protein
MDATVRIVLLLFGPHSSKRTGKVSVKTRPSFTSARECQCGMSRGGLDAAEASYTNALALLPDPDAPARKSRARCESRAARTEGRVAMDAEACDADSPSRGRKGWLGALARSLAPRIAAARGATDTGRPDASVDIETTGVGMR